MVLAITMLCIVALAFSRSYDPQRNFLREQYVRSNTTRWDEIKTNLFFIPVAVFVFAIIRGLIIVWMTGQDYQLSLQFVMWCFIAFVPLAWLNNKQAKKIAKLKKQFDDYQKGL